MAVGGSSCVDVPPFLPRPCCTLVLLLLAGICGALLVKGRNRNECFRTHSPPRNTAIRGPCRGANPRQHSITLPVSNRFPS
ncbi:hypothetical protein JB92DRAFT_2953463, partial [Gautieria morchelliformis]